MVPSRVGGWRGARGRAAGPSPAPASSNAACGFPALRFPADFASRVMRPIGPGALSGEPRSVGSDSPGTGRRSRRARPYSTSSSRSPDASSETPGRFRLRLDVDPSPQVLQTNGCLSHRTPAFRFAEGISTAGPLPSTGVTRLPRYYQPLRHPLVFGRLPGDTGYTAYLSPPISRRDEEGFSSCLARPCHRAVAITPPERRRASARLRAAVLPSSSHCGLGLRVAKLSGPPVRSLSLRPSSSPTIPGMARVDGLQVIGFPPPCHPSYGASGFYPGRTDSC